MAFCINCGATVQGAFCQQCGAQASAAAGQPVTGQPVTGQPVTGQPAGPAAMPGAMAAGQPVMYQPASPAVTPAMAAPVGGKVSPIVWVLLGIVGLFVLGVIGVVSAGVFFVKNPGLVMSKLITASNPNVEVLSTDPGSKTLRIRDKQTGKEVTVSFDDVKNGRFKFSAMGDDGKVASMEMGAGIGKLPAWVFTYPGAKAQGNMTATGEGSDGAGEGGVVTFTTSDAASKVIAFYEGKFKDAGMKVNMTGTTADGGMIVATDESGNRAQHVMVGGGSGGETTIVVTFGRKL